MEVRIRLQKAGKTSKHAYNYRIVAVPRNTGRQTRALEILGYYDAARNPAGFEIDTEKLNKWIEKGAQMSETVRTLVKRNAK
jgi:small subunit ribosomal protein S16